MDSGKVFAYIEGLYEKRQWTQKIYAQAVDLEDFGETVDDDVARMLQVLATLTGPQKILEIGTSIGFSTVSMAKAIEKHGGRILTIEIDAEVAGQAMKNFERDGVKDRIEVRVGDARKIVSGLDEEFDFIFQDVGEKKLYAEMLDDCVRLLKPGGLLVAEDTLFPVADFGPEFADFARSCRSLDVFNRSVAGHPQLESTLLPIGDGLTVAVKKRQL